MSFSTVTLVTNLSLCPGLRAPHPDSGRVLPVSVAARDLQLGRLWGAHPRTCRRLPGIVRHHPAVRARLPGHAAHHRGLLWLRGRGREALRHRGRAVHRRPLVYVHKVLVVTLLLGCLC